MQNTLGAADQLTWRLVVLVRHATICIVLWPGALLVDIAMGLAGRGESETIVA